MIEQHFEGLREASSAERAVGLAAIADGEVRDQRASLLEHSHDGVALAAAVGATAATVKAEPFEESRVGSYRLFPADSVASTVYARVRTQSTLSADEVEIRD